jgi:hypothetical protein
MKKENVVYSTDYLAKIHAGLVETNGEEIKATEKEETSVDSKKLANEVEAKVLKPKSKSKSKK